MPFEQRICSARFFTFEALCHEIREFPHVATRLQNGVGRNRRARQFHDVAETEPVVQPSLVNAGPHATSNGSKVVQSLGATMNLKRWKEKASSFEHFTQPPKSFLLSHSCRLRALADEANL